MDFQSIKRALDDINKLFSPILLETNFNLGNDVVSWPRYMPGILNSLAYAAEYQRLIDQKQFSFLLTDKSFFQLFFKFDSNLITSARLSYYPTPLKLSGAIDDLLEVAEISGVDLLEDLYLGAESWLERGIDIVNTSHIRLDYDSKVTSHCPCHIQFGGINEFRIPSTSLINPFVFFVWICKNIGINQFQAVTEKHSYKVSIGYHLKKSLNVAGVEDEYPHIISGKRHKSCHHNDNY